MPVTDSALQNSSPTLYRAAVICVSDRCFQGLRKDVSSPIIAEMLTGQGYEVTVTITLPDEYEALRKAMVRLADDGSADLSVKHENNTARNAFPRYRRHTKTHADYQPSRKSQGGKGKSFLHSTRFGSRTFDAYRRHAGLRCKPGQIEKSIFKTSVFKDA